MAKKKHFIQTITNTSADPDTGEVLEVESSKLVSVKLTDADEFYMTFCKTTAITYGLRYADDFKLLIKLCNLAEYNTGQVVISQGAREQICAETKIHNTNISKSIKRLLESGVIKGDKGTYVINPKCFWKGDRKSREDLLREKGLSFTLNFTV